MGELVNDILGYLSNFLPSHGYTLLNKFCRDFYFRKWGIILTKYSYLPDDGTILGADNILSKYDIIIKLVLSQHEKKESDYFLIKIYNFISDNNALHHVKEIDCPRIDCLVLEDKEKDENIWEKEKMYRISRLTGLKRISSTIRFKNIYAHLFGLFSKIGKDLSCIIDLESLAILYLDNSWYRIKEWVGKVEAEYLNGLHPCIHYRIDKVYNICKKLPRTKETILKNVDMEMPKYATFQNLREIVNCVDIPDLVLSKLETISGGYISYIPKLLEKYPTIKNLIGEIHCSPKENNDPYKALYQYNFTGYLESILSDIYEMAPEMVNRERECRLLHPNSKKRKLVLFYPGDNNLFNLNDFLEMFDLLFWYYTDYMPNWFEYVPNKLKGFETPVFMTINASSGIEKMKTLKIDNLYGRIIDIFEKKNVLIFPGNFYHLMTEPEFRHIRELQREYFPETFIN